jgi:hypothetical protein
MDTLTIIQSIINLGTERDDLRDQLTVASDSIFAYQAMNSQLRGACDTQAELIQELRTSLAKSRAELDAVKVAPAAAATSEPEKTHMTREKILSVAREALASGRQVRATMDDGKTHITIIREIDDSDMPIWFVNTPAGDGVSWEYLACARTPEDGTAESGQLPMLSRLEIV